MSRKIEVRGKGMSRVITGYWLCDTCAKRADVLPPGNIPLYWYAFSQFNLRHEGTLFNPEIEVDFCSFDCLVSFLSKWAISAEVKAHG